MAVVVGGLVLGCTEPLGRSSARDTAPATGVSENVVDASGTELSATVGTSATTVLVKTTSADDLVRVAAAAGSEVLSAWPALGWGSLSVPADDSVEAFLTRVAGERSVIAVEPAARYTRGSDPGLAASRSAAETLVGANRYASQWSLRAIGAEEAWATTIGDPQIVVAVVDDGVDATHPDFATKVLLDPYDATGLGRTDLVYDGLGTRMAGVAVGNGYNGQVAGVAWLCSILPVGVMDADGNIETAYLVDALAYLGTWARENPNRRMVALIAAGDVGYSEALKDAVDYAIDGGVVIVAAAGDDATRRPVYPAAYDGVLAVASSTPNGGASAFSNRGPWISVAAPGERILTTDLDRTESFVEGTGVAAAHVAGATALLLTTQWGLDAGRIVDQIERTARGDGFSETVGFGVINVAAALGDVASPRYGTIRLATNILSTEQTGDIGVGTVTIVDEAGSLVSYGRTGDDGGRAFYGLAPGEYAVSVSYYERYLEAYDIASATVSVNAGESTPVDLVVSVPTTVEVIPGLGRDAADPDAGEIREGFFLEDTRIFEFRTGFYQQHCDTVLRLYSGSTLIAENDDDETAGYEYSYLFARLGPGAYTVVVVAENGAPLYTTFRMDEVRVTYE